MPAFPASRVLGARASRSHGGKNALLGNAASRHACKKPTPLSSPLVKGGEGRGEGGFEADGFINFGSAIGITPLTYERAGQTLRSAPTHAACGDDRCNRSPAPLIMLLGIILL